MRIHKLDGLRGFFCVMVVLYHYDRLFLPNEVYNFFFIRHSYAFVDFFFVLSGFVISLNYAKMNTKSDFFMYIKKRFIRLFPLLFYSTCVMFFYAFLRDELLIDLFPNTFGTSFNFDFTEYFIKLLNTFTFTDSTPVFGKIAGFNGPAWSISAEMISYGVYGLVLLNFKKFKNYIFVVIILASIIFLFITGEFYAVHDYGFLRGLVSFHLGYFVYLMSKVKYNINNKIELLLPVVIIFLLYILNEQTTSFLINILGVLISLSFALSLFVIINTDGFLSKILDTKLFQFLGKTSFSIYLNHMLLITIYPKVLFKVLHLENNAFNQLLVCISYVFVIIIYSNFTYKYVEIKGSRALKKLLIK